MKTFTTFAAAFALLGVLASAAVAAPATTTPAPKMAGKMMHKKGGYVHATTVMTKSGKMVHRKGYYRHATKPGKMTGKMAAPATPAAPKM